MILFAAQCLQIDATRETAAAYSSGERAPLLYLSSGRYEGERGGGGGGVSCCERGVVFGYGNKWIEG